MYVKFKTVLDRADSCRIRADSEMDKCVRVAQEYSPVELSADYQPSDGLVFNFEYEGDGYNLDTRVVPMEDFFEAVTHKGRKLTIDELLQLCV